MKKIALLIAILLFTSACTAVQPVPTPTPTFTPQPTATETPTPQPTATSRPTATPRPTAIPTPKFPRIAPYISPSSATEIEKMLARLKTCAPQTFDFVIEQVDYIGLIAPEYARPRQYGYLCEPTGCIALNPDVIETAKGGDSAEYRIMLTIAHEARHVWQQRTNMQCTYAECEQDADRFTLPLLDQCPAADPRTIEGNRIIITTRIADPPSGPPP